MRSPPLGYMTFCCSNHEDGGEKSAVRGLEDGTVGISGERAGAECSGQSAESRLRFLSTLRPSYKTAREMMHLQRNNQHAPHHSVGETTKCH